MKNKTRLPKLYNEHEYNGLAINISSYPLVESYLKTIHNLIIDSTNDFKRVTAFRFELRFPKSYRQDKKYNYMRSFWRSVDAQIRAELIRRKNRNVSVSREKLRYVWCEEKNGSSNYHYHLLLLLNKDNFRSIGDYTCKNRSKGKCKHIYEILMDAWARALDVEKKKAYFLVHIPDNCTYYLHRRNDSDNLFSSSFRDEFEALFSRAAYLAKLKTKVYGNNRRSFGSSRRSK